MSSTPNLHEAIIKLVAAEVHRILEPYCEALERMSRLCGLQPTRHAPAPARPSPPTAELLPPFPKLAVQHVAPGAGEDTRKPTWTVRRIPERKARRRRDSLDAPAPAPAPPAHGVVFLRRGGSQIRLLPSAEIDPTPAPS
jgi:hypothetical protein